MKPPAIPLTDDHIHIDPVHGRGLDAARDFMRAGGTHLFLVSKPSWSHGVTPRKGSDYRKVFDETLALADGIRETGLVVFPVLGVHPAEITRLADEIGLEQAAAVMKEGLTVAAGYVSEGLAVALKSGRPHYEAGQDVQNASDGVLSHALSLAGRLSCALQVHAETGPCSDIVDMARMAGADPSRVVKHYGSPDTPLHPSLIATHEEIADLARTGRRFTLESDYMDENSRPGAVTGPKSVPRFTKKLIDSGRITLEQAYIIHAETPEKVYGVEIELS
jgi:TatD-related deoxyribonuclease